MKIFFTFVSLFIISLTSQAANATKIQINNSYVSLYVPMGWSIKVTDMHSDGCKIPKKYQQKITAKKDGAHIIGHCEGVFKEKGSTFFTTYATLSATGFNSCHLKVKIECLSDVAKFLRVCKLDSFDIKAAKDKQQCPLLPEHTKILGPTRNVIELGLYSTL